MCVLVVVQLFATQFALWLEVALVPLHVEVVQAQQSIIGIADHCEVCVALPVSGVHMMWGHVLLVIVALGVLDVCGQPTPDAGAGVLRYVGEYQSVPVAYYHVCI